MKNTLAYVFIGLTVCVVTWIVLGWYAWVSETTWELIAR